MKRQKEKLKSMEGFDVSLLAHTTRAQRNRKCSDFPPSQHDPGTQKMGQEKCGRSGHRGRTDQGRFGQNVYEYPL
jgi:hypothetical protein